MKNHAPDDRRPVIVCDWAGWLETCPHCGSDLPS
jgi:hypothetical protein